MSAAFTIQVPASSTNLGAGYDALGLALGLYLRVRVRESGSGSPEIHTEGEGAGELLSVRENLMWKVIRRVFQGEGRPPPTLRLEVRNHIPLARGLGSSAAAIVAALGTYEALVGEDLSQEKFYRYALEFESHPDNLTAARFGGFTVSCVDEGGRVSFFRTRVADALKVLLVVPDIQLPTSEARAVVPDQFKMSDVIFNLQRSALTVAALMAGQFRFLRESLRDKVHQPYRAPLIPGLQEVLALNRGEIPGLLGLSLSGAGPSVAAFIQGDGRDVFKQVQSIFNRHGVACRPLELEIDNQGRSIREN
ncbi:MAG: homoserine kinase [Acidobacteria bacterium]|nr:homoserine kinase [Acidobacteriota bacterium]